MKRRNRPGDTGAAASTTTTVATQDDKRRTDIELDLALLGGSAADIWAQLFDGQFRLAVPCSRCGRWLTAGASKRHRLGAHCRAKSAAEVTE